MVEYGEFEVLLGWIEDRICLVGYGLVSERLWGVTVACGAWSKSLGTLI